MKQSIDGLILSNAVRAAVVGLLKSLVREYSPDNVLFNNVCPGATATDRLLNVAAVRAEQQGITRDEVIDGMGSRIPLGRVGPARGIRPSGGVSLLGTSGLCYRNQHRDRRWGSKGGLR